MASPDWPQSTAVPRLVGPACDCVLDANAALQDAAPHTHCGRGSMTHLPAGAAAAKIAGAPTKLVGATRGPIAPVVDKRRPVHGVRAGPGQRISHRTLCVGQLPLLPSRARASVRQRGSARRRSDAPPGMYVPPKGCSPARPVQRRAALQLSAADSMHFACACAALVLPVSGECVRDSSRRKHAGNLLFAAGSKKNRREGSSDAVNGGVCFTPRGLGGRGLEFTTERSAARTLAIEKPAVQSPPQAYARLYASCASTYALNEQRTQHRRRRVPLIGCKPWIQFLAH